MKIFLLSALGLCFTLASHAEIALSNLNGPTIEGNALYEFTPFTTGSESLWQLNAVTINAFSFDSEPATINLSLYSDNYGIPGSFFADLGAQNLSALALEVPYLGVDSYFTPPSSVVLQPNTTYWISGTSSGPGSSSVAWNFTSTSAVNALPGWSAGATEYLYNGEWNAFGTGNNTYEFSLDVEAVPEPSGLAIIVMSIVSFRFIRHEKTS